MDVQAELSDRQQSEINYHIDYARKHADLAHKAVDLKVCSSPSRRWWNGYWAFYDLVRALSLEGKRVLVPGCGFGEDCIRIAARGASVFGVDLSPDVASIAAQRAHMSFGKSITIETMPTEDMKYPDSFFDACMLINILHHVDIPKTMAEVLRVTKSGGVILGLEMYTHSAVQKLRASEFIKDKVYPSLIKTIYGTSTPYITPDERKLNEEEVEFILRPLKDVQVKYFHICSERIFSSNRVLATKIDQVLCGASKAVGKLMAGRVLFQAIRP